MKKQTSKGFTLMEVMIIVAIIGIIAAIAMPSYAQYTKRVNRKAAIAKMREMGQMLERQYNTVNKGAYPASYPATTSDGYKITAVIEPNKHQSYLIRATPVPGEAYDEECHTLVITSIGTTGIEDGNFHAPASQCFK